MKRSSLILYCICLLVASAVHAETPVSGTNYYVSLAGNDTNNGLNQATAFQTVQRGVNALCAGDTLTIAPGEYFGAVSRTNMGGPNAQTLIRAEIPGTVIIRGDRLLPAFRKVEDYRFVYATDFKSDKEVQAVNELDTMTVFTRLPSLMELDFQMGGFFHDLEKHILYISTADLISPIGRSYTACVVQGHGIELASAIRVRIEGLAVTGFGRYGILVSRSTGCRVVDCRAYLNGGGIGINSNVRRPAEAGGNVIERSVAWANSGVGLSVYEAKQDTLRDSKSFLNGGLGISMYHGMSRQEGNLVWGNGQYDYQLKQGGLENIHEAERSVIVGTWNHESNSDLVQHCMVGHILDSPHNARRLFKDCIVLDKVEVEADYEFADPINHDYRLQATSRFRGAGENGADLGPFPYKPDIFYVATNGNDAANGLSVSNAWATLGRAATALRPGNTLYIAPGRYRGDLRLKAGKAAGAPIFIRGRGTGAVELAGTVQIEKCHNLTFEYVRFAGPVTASGGGGLVFEQCAFSGTESALTARDVKGLRIIQNEFAGGGKTQISFSGCNDIFLAGNLLANSGGAAVAADRLESVLYADYNFYRKPSAAWRLDGKIIPLDRLPGGMERYGTAAKASEKVFAGTGLYGRPAGNHRMGRDVRLRVVGPFIHAAGATSVNIEWFASHFAKVEIAWGETVDCTNSRTLNSEPDFRPASRHYHSFSLTDLKPATRYYVRIRSVEPTSDGSGEKKSTVEWDSKQVSFETAKLDPAPVIYHVSPEGDDSNSGLEPARALRTLRRAGALVRPGDTVRIAGGVYSECLYVRATGTPERPITFSALPGAHVTLDGNQELGGLLVAFNKSHLRFDGLYLAKVARSTWSGGAIRLFGGEDIHLTRIFYDGRPRVDSPVFVYASGVRNLLIRNSVSVNTGGFSPRIIGCPGFRMENCLVIHNNNGGMLIDSVPSDKAVIRNTIITDCQANKIAVPIAPVPNPGNVREKVLENNAYFLRPERRVQGTKYMVTGKISMAEFEELVLCEGYLLGDPLFAALYRDGAEPFEGFGPEKLTDLTFRDLFATNPEFIKRGIGLNPEDFKDFYPTH